MGVISKPLAAIAVLLSWQAHAASIDCKTRAHEIASHVPGASLGREYGQAIELRGPVHSASLQCPDPPMMGFVQIFWEGAQAPRKAEMDFIVALGAEVVKPVRAFLKSCRKFRRMAPTNGNYGSMAS